jgi:glycosyltransferase involved in cell wall biosynthesis
MAKHLRIGLILQGSTNWVGGVEYTKNLAKALYSLSPQRRSTFDLVPISPGSVPKELYADMTPEFHASLLRPNHPPTRSLLQRVSRALLHRLFAVTYDLSTEAVRRVGVDFVYPYMPPPWWRGPRSAVWIADFQHRYYPEFFTPEEVAWRDTIHGRVARYAPLVVLSSQAVQRDWARFYPFAAAKSRVLSFRTVPAADWWTGDPEAAQQRYRLPDRFFLVCNQFWQHKNHRVVFEAIRQLKESGGPRIEVACTGPLADYRQKGYPAQVRQWLVDWGIVDQVHLLGMLPRADQVQLIRRTLAMIQPSLFEGWSTLIEDGRALGKRMVVSDIPVHHEQAPPQAVYFAPTEVGQLAAVLAEWWRCLSPGPETNAEAEARRRSQQDIEAFAERFLALSVLAA